MRDLEDRGIVRANKISFHEVRDRRGRLRQVRVSGRVDCEEVLVKVDKWLDVRRRKDARDYDYHVMLAGTNQSLLRYDNAHGPATFHRHRFNPHSGRDRIEPITRDELPTLDHVIVEAVEAGRTARSARRGLP